jgi:hypothetical protein
LGAGSVVLGYSNPFTCRGTTSVNAVNIGGGTTCQSGKFCGTTCCPNDTDLCDAQNVNKCNPKTTIPINENCTAYTCAQACASVEKVSYNDPQRTIWNRQGGWFMSNTCTEGNIALEDAWCLCDKPPTSSSSAPSFDENCRNMTGKPDSYCASIATGCGNVNYVEDQRYFCKYLGPIKKYCCVLRPRIMIILNNKCSEQIEASVTDLAYKVINPQGQGYFDFLDVSQVTMAIKPRSKTTWTYKQFTASGSSTTFDFGGAYCN